MKIRDNDNFIEVRKAQYDISLTELLCLPVTFHMNAERMARYNKIRDYIHDYDKVERVFWCDKGHPDGPELHCVTTSGLIFILNEWKYQYRVPCLITILLGRPNQVYRLYEAIGEQPPEETIEWCKYYQWYGLNNI